MQNLEEIRLAVCDVCHKMWQLGWVAANDGNVSAKLEDGTFLVTPTGISKSFITPEKLVIIDRNMKVLSAEKGYKPSSEIKMHMRCYEERDDVGADLITLASMLRIPVSMHNVSRERIFRPHSWAAFGTTDAQAADYEACRHYGPLYR